MKLKLPIIFTFLCLLGLSGFSKNHNDLNVWSTPVSFELEAVALLNLPDALFYASKNELSLAKVESYVAPPCPVAGTSCDDKNPNTINDVADGNCNCSGVPISCDGAVVSYEINAGDRLSGAATVTVGQGEDITLFSNLENYTVTGPNGIVTGGTIANIGSAQAGIYTVNGTYRRAISTAAPIVQYASSQEGTAEVAPATNALDGDPGTYWHSQYGNGNLVGYPHELQFDMGEGSVLSGFTYLPRQGTCDGCSNGRVGSYEIYVSNSTTNWGTPVARGFDGGTGANAPWGSTMLLETANFPAKQGRYLRFVAISPATAGQPWATAAEITVKRVTATASSALAANPASNANDNNTNTFWQTASGATGSPFITLDLGIESNVTGLEYVPRQTGTVGRITTYDVFVSNSLSDFGTRVGYGTWSYSNPTSLKLAANFIEKRGRYVRLVSKSGTAATAAEVRAIRSTVNIPCTKTIQINVDPIETFTFTDGTWAPRTPIGNATSNDAILISSGNVLISSNMTSNTLTINPGASLTIGSGVTVTANSTTLKSTSVSYSSLILNGLLEGVVSYERFTNIIGTSASGGNDLISAPLTGVVFGPFAAANANLAASGIQRAFAPYVLGLGAYKNYNITDNVMTTITSGVGFRAATTNGSNLIYTGSVAKANVDVPVSGAVEGKAWNLIGNPYPSYLNVGDFFSPNNIAQLEDSYVSIYGYKGSKSDWEVYNLANNNDALLAPGQGFFVKGKPGMGIVEFTPAMRRTGSSDDFIAGRSNTSKALSKLKLSSPSKEVSTSVYFIEGTTRGLDPGYDAAVYGATAVDFSIYTNLVKDNSKLDIAIQSLPYDDFNGVVVPLGIKAKAGTELVISIDDLSTIPSNVNVYLEDVENKTLTLLNIKGFRFTPSVDINSSDLYKIHYSARTLSVDDMQMNDDLRIYTTAAPKALFVKGQLTKNTTASLYDIQGRLVLRKVLNSNSTENKIDISTINTGVYVVKINNDNQVKTQKVIIK
ncbi:discoidin domain-containing protein [Gelidibacter mesophilus]|uniref:discoidin domain-containing protein n=1 Tax=Gelidibacter mesophilus TaxID=169050 RepID=UPI0004000E82|nr:discoidin domain-containing protein [Gelidibacter mesophilus]